MEIFTRAEYLTAVQGTLRAILALCALVLVILCTNRRFHIPASKYFLYFVIAMGLWGFFGSIFFAYPDIHLLPSIRPLMYTAISFGGPTFMLFCFSYAFPHKKNVDKILTVYFYPSLRFFTVRHPATPYSNIPSFLPMRSGPFPTGILSNTTASCFLYTPSIVPEQFYWAVQCSFR